MPSRLRDEAFCIQALKDIARRRRLKIEPFSRATTSPPDWRVSAFQTIEGGHIVLHTFPTEKIVLISLHTKGPFIRGRIEEEVKLLFKPGKIEWE